MANHCIIGDIGTNIYVDVIENISTSTVRKILVQKPSGATPEWVGTVDGTTRIKFTTIAGSLDEAGSYKLQAFVTMPTGTWRGDVVCLEVRDLFQ